MRSVPAVAVYLSDLPPMSISWCVATVFSGVMGRSLAPSFGVSAAGAGVCGGGVASCAEAAQITAKGTAAASRQAACLNRIFIARDLPELETDQARIRSFLNENLALK